VAEEFLNHNIILSRAKIDRVQGANQVRNYLAWQNLANGRTRPRFFIFETCQLSYDCLTRMQHDPDNVEDVLKMDATDGDPLSGDDTYDMIRYALMSRPLLPDQLRNNLAPGSAEWNRKQVEEMEAVIQKQIKEPDELWGDHELEAGIGSPSERPEY